jgi:ABC-type transport system involved in multi-copper enzyme maturation permease subunit
VDWHEYLEQATKGVSDNNEASEIRRELFMHLNCLTEELVEQGMDSESARVEAVKRMAAPDEISGMFKTVYNASRPQKIVDFYASALLWSKGKLLFGSLVKVEIKRALSKWTTGIAFVILLAFCLQGLYSFYTFFPNSMAWRANHQATTFNAYQAFLWIWTGPSDFIVGVFPLLVTMGAGDSLAWDRKTGFMEFIISRTTSRRYIIAKIVSASIVGFLLVMLTQMISIALSLLVFPHATGNTGYVPPFLSGLYASSPFLYILLVALISAVAGMAFAVIAVILSTVVKNVFLVVIGPWLLFVVVSLLCYDYYHHHPHVMLPYSPLVILGPYINERVVSPMYIAAVPLVWIAVWGLGSVVAYAIFIRRVAPKRSYH